MATGFDIHRKQKFFFYQRDSSFTSSPDNNNQSKVTFKFSLQSTISDWFVGPTNIRLSGRINQPTIESYILINPNDPIEKARETIDKNLRIWPVNPSRLREMIDAALNKAREMVECMTPHHSYSVNLHFQAHAFNFRIFRAVESDQVRMVPAVESSIEGLEKKRVDCETSCSVCLEEVLLGGEGMLMPCLHVFHEDCIKKWLRTSHYCPVCRFEMPKNE